MYVSEIKIQCVVHVKASYDEEISLDDAKRFAIKAAHGEDNFPWLASDWHRENYDHYVIYLEKA